MSIEKQKLNSAEREYIRVGEEQKERTRRIVTLRVDLKDVVTELWKQTEVEEGCWVPCLERMDWLKRILADSLANVVSENEGRIMKVMKCPACKEASTFTCYWADSRMSMAPIFVTSDGKAGVDMEAGRQQGSVDLSRHDIDKCQCEKCNEQVPIDWIEVVEVAIP
jgi:hypothetical protein